MVRADGKGGQRLASQRNHEQLISELEARDLDAVIKTMTRHRGAEPHSEP